MTVWNRENNEFIIDYWGNSPIDWQQKNRDVLNAAIKIYNNYVRGIASLEEVQDAVYYAEDRLANEAGTYMDDIELMKNNVDEIEKKRNRNNY